MKEKRTKTNTTVDQNKIYKVILSFYNPKTLISQELQRKKSLYINLVLKLLIDKLKLLINFKI